MIALARPAGSAPRPLTGKALSTKNQALIDSYLAGQPEFLSDYWKPAKPILRKQTAGKCAYCESKADTVAYCDVEHFRPKTIYWWLAYWYENYLYSCQICNQLYKKAQFPVSGVRLQVPAELHPDRLYPRPAELQAEQAQLPDLYADDPGAIFNWEVDTDAREVTITSPLPGFQAAATNVLGLNREELRRTRYRIYEILATFRLACESPEVPASIRRRSLEMMRTMSAAEAPYAGMVRYFLDQWKIGST